MNELGDLASMQGADAEYARRMLKAGPGNMETFTLQARTTATRDAYALAISGGAFDFSSLISWVLEQANRPENEQDRFTRSFDARAFLSLARVIANQSSDSEGLYPSVQIFKMAIRTFGTKALSRTDRLIFLEALASLGFVRDVRKYARILKIDKLDRNQENMLDANVWAKRDLESHSGMASERWLELVNAGYRKSGIETISFAPGDGPLFDRIIAGPADHVVDGPKVTVIVPTFNSGSRIATALRSLMHQTWRNLEVLVMDDASPESNDRFLLEWEQRDSRIRVHKMAENGGTYRARNFALTHLVTGDFVTVHDDDDWSHPRKIETQVRQLIEQPELVANMSLLSRATPELVFTRINNNPVFTQPNYSSLMFRRELVIGRIGYWDLVNRSADAEFHDRIKAEFGDAVGVAGVDVLSFLRVRADSLTSGEISRGYIDRRRLWYQQSSRKWHSRTKEAGGSIRIEAFPETPRPFSAPSNMIGSKQGKGAVIVDVLYVTDFRFPGGNSSLAANELELLLAAGYRVGVMHMASPVIGPREPIRPRFLELAQNPLVSVVSLLDEVEANLTLVRHPSVLQYPEYMRSGVQTNELVVIVNHAPYTKDGLGSIYDLGRVMAMAESIFGRAPKLAPESDLIRDAISAEVPPESVLSDTWPGVIEVPQHADSARVKPERIIGRHSRDHVNKWPETLRSITLSYPTSGNYEVRILGGAETPLKLLGKCPDNWTVHPFGAISPGDFLEGIPFWVYQHHSDLTESFGMAAAEAMAAGCVVILPTYMQVNFGKGAVYADPEDVLTVIEGFVEDPPSYYAQRERGIATARARFSSEAFYSRVKTLLEVRFS